MAAGHIMDYSKLPEHIQQGFRDYIEYGVPMGDFGTAVLENDLMEAFMRADETNIARMFDIVSFVYNEAPSACHGSREKVKSWLAHDWSKEVE